MGTARRPLEGSWPGLTALRGLWRFLGSTRFALVIIGLLAGGGLLGTVLPQVPAAMRGNGPAVDGWLDFQEGKFGIFTEPMHRLGLFDVFHSRWFTVLLTLLVISAAVYTISRLSSVWREVFRPQEEMPDAFFERARRRASLELPAGRRSAVAAAFERRRYRVKTFRRGEATYVFADRYSWAQLGTLLSHVALVLFLVGGFYSRMAGFQVDRLIAEGASAPVFDSLTRPDQMQVHVVDAIARFDGAGNPLDYRTELAVYQGGREVARGEATVNDPLRYRGYSFHQAAYFGDGAALRIRDADSGRTVYDEVLSLGESTPAPELVVWDAGGRLLLDDVIVPTDFVAGAGGTLARLPGRDAPFWLGVRPDANGEGWQLVAYELAEGREGIRLVAPEGRPAAGGGLEFELRRVVNLPSLAVADLPGRPGESILIMAPDAEEVPYLTLVGAPDSPAVTLREGSPFVAHGRQYEFLGRRDFAGISVRRDPGTNFIWIATGLLLLGLGLTFYVPRSRVWAKMAGDRIWFAGATGPGVNFDSEIKKVAAAAMPPDRGEDGGRREET